VNKNVDSVIGCINSLSDLLFSSTTTTTSPVSATTWFGSKYILRLIFPVEGISGSGRVAGIL
jgi:hypothetical protein